LSAKRHFRMSSQLASSTIVSNQSPVVNEALI
jgi:hypothetical protein